jgi:DNA polymerase-3 subunit delta
MPISKSEITHEEALRSLHPEKLSPCYLVYGEEPFFVNQVLRWFIENAVLEELRPFNYNRFDGDKITPKEVIIIAKSYPMGGRQRMIILDHAEKIKDPEEHLLSYLNAPSQTTVMVFVAPKPDMRTRFFAGLKKQAALIGCRPLYDNEVPRFIQQEATRQGIRLTNDAAWHLHESLGKNPYLIQQELQKISLMTAATVTTNGPLPPGVKTPELSDRPTAFHLSTPGREHSVFELTAAVGEKDAGKALQLTACLLSEGEPPLMILSMLVRHFRMMAEAKEGLQSQPESVIGKQLPMPPSRVTLFLKQLRLWKGEEIRLAFDYFKEVDGQLKGGRTAPAIMLEGLILTLCQSTPSDTSFLRTLA